MAHSSGKNSNKNRSHSPKSAEFRDFMKSGWSELSPRRTKRSSVASYARKRRDSLDLIFQDVTIIIEAGLLKCRSNDTSYPYRPSSAFSYLTGWGASAEPGSVLVGLPTGRRHNWKLYMRSPADRDSDEFYADSEIGEFWTGPRPGLDSISQLLDIETADLSTWDIEKHDRKLCAVMQDDNGLSVSQKTRRNKNHPNDERLARAISDMRLVKDSYEVSEIRNAIESTRRGFDDIIAVIPHALSHPRGERLIESTFHTRARLEGNGVGYGTIAASGEHSCILHWTENTGKLAPGELLLVDAGVERDSLYTADITRTLPVSGAFSAEQLKIYKVVLEASDAAFTIVRPGASLADVHSAAMKAIAQGLEKLGLLPVDSIKSLSVTGQHHRRYMIHSTSHHLGLDVHDCARTDRQVYLEGPLKEGMVFTIEPGIYFHPNDITVPKKWRGIGIRLEDNVLVTRSGSSNLSGSIPRTPEQIEEWLTS